MDKYEIIKKIENFAPVENAESWDASGWIVETDKKGVSKIMLCLTPTDEIVLQAKKSGCDMIISHHPAFYVPCSWKNIDIYCAHTNLDKACGGTTDTLIATLGLVEDKQLRIEHEYLRFVEFGEGISIDEFSKMLSVISPNGRIINNRGIKELHRIAFCAGSGSDFIQEAQNLGADCLVTGDLKFHTALDSEIVVYDIGHFESEILVLPVIGRLIDASGIDIIYAREKSPFEPLMQCSD